MKGSFLGPSYDDATIVSELEASGAVFRTLDENSALEAAVTALVAGKAVGWFQGRMEFGPRALGARSILADPRSEAMQRLLNLKIKFRESFRPFAPSVLAEDAQEYFDLAVASPYMLLVSEVTDDLRVPVGDQEEAIDGLERLNVVRSKIPAVTHVDYSARVQTVHSSTNPRFHALLELFRNSTGCSVLVNTSFNVRGEPIVCTPRDAFNCFMGTELDFLIIENTVLYKDDQDSTMLANYRDQYALD